MASIAHDVREYVTERRRSGRYSKVATRQLDYVLATFIDVVGADTPTSKLKRAHVERWMVSRPLAVGTVRARFSMIRCFCEWAAIHGKVRANPCAGMRPPKLPRLMPRELEVDEIGRLLAAVPDVRGELIVLLMAQEGLRRAEVAGLQVGDVDHRDRTLFVRGKGGHERLVPISDETDQAMRHYLAEHPGAGGALIRSDRHTGQGLTPGHVGRLVAEWMRDAGLKERPFDGKSAHALRHSCAGDMLDAGADLRDVQEMLGHASLQSTVIYTRRRVAMERLRDAAAGRQYRPTVEAAP